MAQTCYPPSINWQPENTSGCEGSYAFFGTSGAFAQGYQWQVNTGSGFVDLTNDGTHFDVTANLLSIYNLTPGMDGNVYRAIILGSSPTCYTISASAVLHVAPISATAVLTNPTCFGGTNGAIELTVSGGSGIYGYYWSGNYQEEPDLINAAAGTHTVIIGDDKGCYAEATTFTLTQPSQINVSGVAQGNPYCHNINNGYIEVSSSGGTGAHTYLWTPSGQTGSTASGLGGGVHTVTVTDAVGCTKTMSFTLVQPQPLQATVTTSNVSCNGMSNGAASVNATGGPSNFSYNYQWSAGSNYPSVTGLAPGNYSILVYAGMCSVTQPFTISQPNPLTSELVSFSNLQCNNASDGTAWITADGGTGGYTFNWSTSSETAGNATDLPAGTTEVIITDERGCTSMQSFVLTEPSPIVLVTDSIHAAACHNSSDGALYITVTGGSPYIIGTSQFYSVTLPSVPATANSVQNWQQSSMSEHLTGLTAGSYELTFHDVNGCPAVITVPVSAPDPIVVTLVNQENVSCYGLNDGSAEVAATGGTGDLTFNWDSGTTSPMDDQLPAGDFTVYATDEHNCSSQYTVTISEPSQLVTDSVISDVSCYGGSNGAIDLTPAGGTAPYTFEWDDTSTSEDRTGLATGIYSVTISDDHNCSITISSSVSQPAEMLSSFSAANCDSYTWNAQTYTTSGLYTHVYAAVNGCDSTVTLNLTITNATTGSANQTACHSITWNGQTYVTSGTYIQTLTNAAGCDSTVTLNLTILTTPEMTAVDNNDGSITASSADHYQWIDCATGNAIPGADSQMFTAALNGTYAVAGTSNSGCSDTSACVTINYLGVAEQSLSAITLAPNPTQNLVTVQFDELTTNVTIRDAQGKSLAFQNIVSGEQISLISYPAGVYFFEFATAKGVTTKRVVKND